MNPETKQIEDLILQKRHLRFKCQRCAVFCCKLGGPSLTGKDVERIKRAGYDTKDFLEPASKGKFKGNLKNNEDGSCVFLKPDPERNEYECSIYSFRPVLCRLYPFAFEKASPDCVVLRLIPCCRGINNPDGELTDKRFITNQLLDAILELF